jgi:acetylornithine deacetylase/succinyl-diaminopimelate desuccinylase-like protein
VVYDLSWHCCSCPLSRPTGIRWNWKQLQPEILNYYTSLIRIDTTNPPGNETQAAEFLKGILDREGIASQIFALDPKRANLVARVQS